MTISFERAALLMHTVEQVTKVAPRATHLLGLAMAELIAMDDEAKTELDERTKEADEARRNADAKRVAEATAANEANQPKAVPASTFSPNDDIDRELPTGVVPQQPAIPVDPATAPIARRTLIAEPTDV